VVPTLAEIIADDEETRLSALREQAKSRDAALRKAATAAIEKIDRSAFAQTAEHHHTTNPSPA
jgi:hypothetical protein